MTPPTTIPAIAPAESLMASFLGSAPAAPLPVAVGVDDDVVEGNKGGRTTDGGSTTPTQRPPTFEAMQQESVALGELVAQ